MPLVDKLAGMSPAENDSYLSEVWRQFTRTEQFEALCLALNQITEEANVLLLSPHTEDRSRAHAAGQVTAIRRLLVTIGNAVSFDPKTAVYDKPFDVIPGGPDNDDDTQLAPNGAYGVTPLNE